MAHPRLEKRPASIILDAEAQPRLPPTIKIVKAIKLNRKRAAAKPLKKKKGKVCPED